MDAGDSDHKGAGFTFRPVELPGSRPLRFETSQDIGSLLPEWPVEHCIKALCFYHPDDEPALKQAQQEKLRGLFEAARKVGRELLIEIIASKNGPLEDDTIARARRGDEGQPDQPARRHHRPCDDGTLRAGHQA